MSDVVHSCSVEISDEEIVLNNSSISVAFNTKLGYITLRQRDSLQEYFTRGYGQVVTQHTIYDTRKLIFKAFTTLDFDDHSGCGKVLVIKLEDVDKTVEMNLRFVIRDTLNGYSSIIQIRNKSGNVLKIQTFNPLMIDVDNSSRLFTGWDYDSLRIFRNGFHSWELSQAQRVEVGDNVSHFYSVLHDIWKKDAMVIGFLTMADQLSTVSFVGRTEKDSRLAEITASSLADGVSLSNKEHLMSEELLVLVGNNAYKQMDEYIEIVSKKMQSVSWQNVPAGWCSWYFYFTMIDESEFLQNASFLKERMPDYIEWIQLDDGFQKVVGDWETNFRFPSGLKVLVEKINEMGFKAGVWVAPFVAAEHSTLFQNHPDWFLKNDEEQPLAVDENPLWLGKYYALDLTQDEVILFIQSVFKELKNDGFEYFKIDFLYHAAADGNRENMDMTRAQAVRKGLETIREAVGDSFILGCGAPLGPCVGITNGMRIGTDIATDWRYEWGGGVYECSVNTMTRAVLHDKLWINDPDCVLVRQEDTALTLDEVILFATVVALSGGITMLSDRMMEVSEERLQILDRILPPYRKGGKCLDYLDEENPRIFAIPIETPAGFWTLLGLFNLNSAPIDIKIKFQDLGLDKTVPHHIFDFWNQSYEGLYEENFDFHKLKPHSCKLLVIKPESEIPDLLSTSIHFTQGATEISILEWDNDKMTLDVTVSRSTKHEESLFFVQGDQWNPVEARINDNVVELQSIAPEVVAVKALFKKGQRITVVYSRSEA